MLLNVLHHVHVVKSVLLDEIGAQVEDGSICEVDGRLRHGECQTDAVSATDRSTARSKRKMCRT